MSRGLRDRRRVRRSLVPRPQAGNHSIYGPRMFFSWCFFVLDNRSFERERRLFPCHDFLLGMFPFCRPSYYSTHSPHYDQTLAGILPYRDDSDRSTIIRSITRGERPSRPRDPSQTQWLPDRVWGVITTGWSDKPERRCELSVMHHLFSTTSPQETQGGKLGD